MRRLLHPAFMSLVATACLSMSVVPATTFAQPTSSGALQSQADSFFGQNDFKSAETILLKLSERDPSDANVLFQLARAIHEQSDYERAIAAYRAARTAKFQPSARIDYHMARIEADRGNIETAISLLESMAKTSGPIAATVKQTPEFASLSETAEFQAVLDSLAPCGLPEYRDFDFWVGEWKVTAAGQPYNRTKSRIESIQNGCAVLENYDAGNFAGTSINFYDARRKVWHQSWMSNTGNVFYAEGGLNEKGQMVLTDRDLSISEITGTVNMVTWTLLDNGQVRQHWQASTDQEKTWQTVFDGYYEKITADG